MPIFYFFVSIHFLGISLIKLKWNFFLCLSFLEGFLMFFFLWTFFYKAFFDKIEGDFFLYCPLPGRLPSGSSANFTERGALRRVWCNTHLASINPPTPKCILRMLKYGSIDFMLYWAIHKDDFLLPYFVILHYGNVITPTTHQISIP